MTLLVPLVLLGFGRGTTSGASIGNATASEEELVDSKDVSRPEGGCGTDGCVAFCRQRMHASGRCDQDQQCVCRDFKQRSRCLALGQGCGCDGCSSTGYPPAPAGPGNMNAGAPGVVSPGGADNSTSHGMGNPVVPASPGVGGNSLANPFVNTPNFLNNIINNNNNNVVVIKGKQANVTLSAE